MAENPKWLPFAKHLLREDFPVFERMRNDAQELTATAFTEKYPDWATLYSSPEDEPESPEETGYLDAFLWYSREHPEMLFVSCGLAVRRLACKESDDENPDRSGEIIDRINGMLSRYGRERLDWNMAAFEAKAERNRMRAIEYDTFLLVALDRRLRRSGLAIQVFHALSADWFALVPQNEVLVLRNELVPVFYRIGSVEMLYKPLAPWYIRFLLLPLTRPSSRAFKRAIREMESGDWDFL